MHPLLPVYPPTRLLAAPSPPHHSVKKQSRTGHNGRRGGPVCVRKLADSWPLLGRGDSERWSCTRKRSKGRGHPDSNGVPPCLLQPLSHIVPCVGKLAPTRTNAASPSADRPVSKARRFVRPSPSSR